MKQHRFKCLVSIAALLVCFGFSLNAQNNIDTSKQLSKKEKCIVVIAACAAQGNEVKLQTALNAGLDAGLTIGEVKEMLVQLYAYTGFPRSLNALTNLMAVLDERKKKGINDAAGKESSADTDYKTMLKRGTENQAKLTGRKIGGGVYEFAPVIDEFIKVHLFGAIFSRDILDWKTREIVTIAALAALGNVEPQLRSHFNVGMYNGLTSSQLSELVTIVEINVNAQRGIIAREVLRSLLDDKPYNSITLPDNLIFSRGEKITNNNFIGTAHLYQMIMPDSLNQTMVGCVTFEPGARSNWHRHPAGQILVIVDGTGYYQEQGSPKRIIKKGESIKCPPNIPHWHGASKNEQLIQIAITNNQNGPTVWLQPVTEEEYNSPSQK